MEKTREERMKLLNMSYEEFVASYQSGVNCHTEGCDCDFMKAFQAITGKWRMVVIYQLAKKPSFRFGELRKAVPGITNTMLTTTLRELESYGIVAREQFNEIPPHVEYSLTEKGKELFPIFYEMVKWSAKYL